MLPKRFLADRGGSAVQWFAYAALFLTLSCVAIAQSAAWLSQAGRLPTIAILSKSEREARVSNRGIDPMPTGSVARPNAPVR